MAKPASTKLLWVGIATATIVAAVLRILFAGENLWLDELHTSWVVDGSFGDVAGRAQIGNQSPLYFWLVWPIVNSLGQSEFALRLLSIGAGVLLVPITALFAYRLCKNSAAAVFSAFWIAVDIDWFVFYGTEARPYVLVQLFAVIQVFYFWNWMTTPRDNSKVESGELLKPPLMPFPWGLLISSTFLFYLHYTAALIFVFEIVFLLLAFLNRKRFWIPGPIRTLQVSVGFLLLIAPSLFHLADVFGRRDAWIAVSSTSDLFEAIKPRLIMLLLIPTILVFCFNIIMSGKTKPEAQTSDNKPENNPPLKPSPSADVAANRKDNAWIALFLLLWGSIPIGLAMLLDSTQTAPLAMVRYCLVATPAFAILAGMILGLIQSPVFRRLAIALLLGTIAGVQINTFVRPKQTPHLRFENWPQILKVVTDNDRPQDAPILLFANILEDREANSRSDDKPFVDYLKFPLTGIYDIDAERITPMPTLSDNPFDEKLHAKVLDEKMIWIIVRGRREDPFFVLEAFSNFAKSKNVTYQASLQEVEQSDVYLIEARRLGP